MAADAELAKLRRTTLERARRFVPIAYDEHVAELVRTTVHELFR